MFRRFTDRLSAAVYGDEAEDKVRVLQTMGFDPNQARNALNASGGNVDRAAELLLSGQNFGATTSPDSSNDVALQNALKESMQTEEQRRYKVAQEASIQRPSNNNKKAASSTTKTRTAASTRAGQAAANRANNNRNNTASAHRNKNSRSPIQQAHPNVKVPTRLEDKSKEEQILRNVNRVKSHPAAVDTLYKALVALRNDPNNSKFRSINKTTAGYKRSLANAPGAEALLITCNFVASGNTLTLHPSRVDPALLYLAVSALEEAKQSTEYLEAKRKDEFAKEISKIRLAAENSVDESVRRANYIAKCPSEPSSGSGALMQVTFGSPDEVIRRRFDGDDVLRDILNWLGGNFGSVVPDKLLSREWCIVDMNRFPVSPIDCELNMDKTLQFIGFWPSGKLDIRPSPTSWVENNGMDDDSDMKMGSARGLGAAPSDALRRI